MYLSGWGQSNEAHQKNVFLYYLSKHNDCFNLKTILFPFLKIENFQLKKFK